MRNLLVILLVVLALLISGCATTKPEATPTPTTIIQTPTPEPTVTRPLPGVDPIIGVWDNGMIFNADHTVGNNPDITWKVNVMEPNSYFVTVSSGAMQDKETGRRIDPTAQSREWVYVPASDTIHMRGSVTSARRTLLSKLTVTWTPA